jgi:hypothetical protein
MPDKSKQYCINFQLELYWSEIIAVGNSWYWRLGINVIASNNYGVINAI